MWKPTTYHGIQTDKQHIKMIKFIAPAAFILAILGQVHGHGRLRVPYSRSTLWRYIEEPEIKPYESIVEANYNDNELFCGGFQYQQNLGGKCGVCGDAWDAAVKDNEAGGKYAKGIIVAQYLPGSRITATVEITAHHKGYFEFRLCPWNNTLVPITHECLDQYVLENDKTESPKWNLPTSVGGSSQYYDVNLYLPEGVECDQCVLQWKYHAGNTFSCDEDGNCCTGCGPQEEFYGCADIAIGTGPTLPPPSFSGSTTQSNTKPTGTTTTTSTTTTTTTTTPGITATQSTTTPGGDAGLCSGQAGSHKHDCDSFYTCSGTTAFYYDCPPATVYDEVRSVCDYAFNVPPPCGTKV